MSFWLQHTIVFLIAALPAMAWLYIFLRRQKGNRWMVAAAFLAGMLAAKLILVYQGYWDSTVNLIFFKVSFVDFRSNIGSMITNVLLAGFLTFVGVGAMEELLKFWMMKWIGRRFFRSIDEVILLSVVTALGFAFLENVLYFSHQWGNLDALNFFLFAASRLTIVTMVHILCSGVLGYYFGMAYFADPVLALEEARKKPRPFLSFLQRILHLGRAHIYHDQMILKGLAISVGLHALYDFLLFAPLRIPPLALMLVMLAYFFGGYGFLRRLLRRKDLHLKLGLVGTSMLSREHFARLVAQVAAIRADQAAGPSSAQPKILPRKSRKESHFSS